MDPLRSEEEDVDVDGSRNIPPLRPPAEISFDLLTHRQELVRLETSHPRNHGIPIRPCPRWRVARFTLQERADSHDSNHAGEPIDRTAKKVVAIPDVAPERDDDRFPFQ